MSLQRQCDRCGKYIPDESKYFHFSVQECRDSTGYSNFLPQKDLCSDCYHKVFSKKKEKKEKKDGKDD